MNEIAILGLDHYSKTFRVNNRDINLQLFDTGGIPLDPINCAIKSDF